MKKIFYLGLLLFIPLCIFVGCGDKSSSAVGNVESNELQFQGVKSGDTIAIITTNYGVMKAVLYPTLAPVAVENFMTHAQNGYYNNLLFYRTVKDFVIQTGDPLNNGTGGESIWNLPFHDEFSDRLHHYTGALSMANSGSNTNRSQFFIVTTKPKGISKELMTLLENAEYSRTPEVIETYKQAGGAPYLDYKHTVFGHIYEGLETAMDISKVKVDKDEKPVKDVIIESIEISTIEYN